MPLTGGTLRVEGLAELQRHFAVIDKELSGDLRDGLRKAAEPVRLQAESLTAPVIGSVGSTRAGRRRVPWHLMRVGVTRAGVYMVPRQRGSRDQRRRRRSYRTTVLPLMLAALHRNEGRVRREAERAINRSIDKWGRG